MYYGIDIGGTTAKIGAFKDDKLIKTWTIDMHVDSLETMVDNILNSIKKQDSEILGIGIDCPGFITNNLVRSSANLHFLDGIDLKQAFSKKVKCPVRVINDANCHAFGEAKAKNLDNIMFITLGTGVGGGFVLGGQVLEGAFGSFMEIGHMHVDDDYNFRCGCGQIGCLETVCGQKGVHNLVNYYRSNYPTKLEIDFTVKDVFDLAKLNDPLVYKVVEVFTDKLGLALANAAIIINPQTIIIGGGISMAGEFLLKKVKSAFLKYANENLHETKIILASLGSEAGMYGAYYLVKDSKK